MNSLEENLSSSARAQMVEYFVDPVGDVFVLNTVRQHGCRENVSLGNGVTKQLWHCDHRTILFLYQIKGQLGSRVHFVVYCRNNPQGYPKVLKDKEVLALLE